MGEGFGLTVSTAKLASFQGWLPGNEAKPSFTVLHCSAVHGK